MPRPRAGARREGRGVPARRGSSDPWRTGARRNRHPMPRPWAGAGETSTAPIALPRRVWRGSPARDAPDPVRWTTLVDRHPKPVPSIKGVLEQKAGIEPATFRLTAECSTHELHLHGDTGGSRTHAERKKIRCSDLAELQCPFQTARPRPGIQSRQRRLHRGRDHLRPLGSVPESPEVLNSGAGPSRSTKVFRPGCRRGASATLFQGCATFENLDKQRCANRPTKAVRNLQGFTRLRRSRKARAGPLRSGRR